MKKWIWIALVVAVVAAAGYYGYKKYQEKQLAPAA
jgi:hypothetical protein